MQNKLVIYQIKHMHVLIVHSGIYNTNFKNRHEGFSFYADFDVVQDLSSVVFLIANINVFQRLCIRQKRLN